MLQDLQQALDRAFVQPPSCGEIRRSNVFVRIAQRAEYLQRTVEYLDAIDRGRLRR